MLGFIVHVLVSATLLFLVGRMVDGIEVRDAKAALIGSLVLGSVNSLMWMVVGRLAFPWLMLTFGLFGIVLMNAVALRVTASLVRGLNVRSFPAAVMGAVALGVMNLLLAILLR
ncbi:MAG: phage holin family protein [Gemmatimonadetes bacterium]|nr:phage holin family protein [Gemmatimonadota bacterium]